MCVASPPQTGRIKPLLRRLAGRPLRPAPHRGTPLAVTRPRRRGSPSGSQARQVTCRCGRHDNDLRRPDTRHDCMARVRREPARLEPKLVREPPVEVGCGIALALDSRLSPLPHAAGEGRSQGVETTDHRFCSRPRERKLVSVATRLQPSLGGTHREWERKRPQTRMVSGKDSVPNSVRAWEQNRYPGTELALTEGQHGFLFPFRWTGRPGTERVTRTSAPESGGSRICTVAARPWSGGSSAV